MLLRRTAARGFVVAAALVSVSCTKKSDTGSENPAPPAEVGPPKPEQPAEYVPPREGESTNLDSLRAYLDTFYHGDAHPHIVPAICADRTATRQCTDSVTIQAIGLSKDISADSGPTRGRVIGQIRNHDARNLTELDSLKPESQATYYIYVDRAANSRARWNLLEVPNAPKGAIRRIVQKEVTACREKPGWVWVHSDVDFANCGEHAFTGMRRAELLNATGLIDFFSRLEKYLRAQRGNRHGKWYGCPGGCCT